MWWLSNGTLRRPEARVVKGRMRVGWPSSEERGWTSLCDLHPIDAGQHLIEPIALGVMLNLFA
jgi:hypothetical protein